jgi:hypothetical protein
MGNCEMTHAALLLWFSADDKIRTTITDVPGAVDLLLALGWVQEDDCLTIPAGVYMTMKEVSRKAQP